MSFLNALVKLQDTFSDKMIRALDYKVFEVMSQEDYTLIELTNSEDYYKNVDKYEIDLSAYIQSI